MLKKITLILLSFVLTFTKATNVTFCEQDVTRGQLKIVKIKGCRQQTCTFKPNSEIMINQRFFSPRDVDSVMFKTWITNGNGEKNMSIDRDDGCNYIFGPGHKINPCPLKNSHKYWLRVKIRITTDHYESGVLHWSLVEKQTGTPITCAKLEYKISVLDTLLQPVAAPQVGIPTGIRRYWGSPAIFPMPDYDIAIA